MKKICKVKPAYSTCKKCVDAQVQFNGFKDCETCLETQVDCELMKIVVSTGFMGDDYAVVLCNGKLEKVLLNRVFDVREV